MRPIATTITFLLAASIAFGQAKPPAKPKISKGEAAAYNAMILRRTRIRASWPPTS